MSVALSYSTLGGLIPKRQLMSVFAVPVSLVAHQAATLPQKKSTRRLKRIIIVFCADVRAFRGRRKYSKDKSVRPQSRVHTGRVSAEKTHNFKTLVYD
jgi:hypothetical protein